MLIFLLRTRPDIAFAVNTLATRCAGDTLRDLDAIHEVILFLKCTAHLELSYTLLTLINITRLVFSTVGWMLLTLVNRYGKSHSGMCLSWQVQQYQQEAVSCLPQFDRG